MAFTLSIFRGIQHTVLEMKANIFSFLYNRNRMIDR